MQILCTRKSGGDPVGVNSIDVSDAGQYVGQQWGAVQPAPALLRALGQTEDHHEHRLPREATADLIRAQTHRGEGRPWVGFVVRICVQCSAGKS